MLTEELRKRNLETSGIAMCLMVYTGLHVSICVAPTLQKYYWVSVGWSSAFLEYTTRVWIFFFGESEQYRFQ